MKHTPKFSYGIVGNGSRGFSGRVNLFSKNGSVQRDLGQPFFVVDIEVPENNNLGIWVLLEKAMELLGSDLDASKTFEKITRLK